MQLRGDRVCVALLCAIGCGLFSSSSFAEESVSVEDVDRGGYAYVFRDDPLGAIGSSAASAMIRVIPGPVRRTLIRPRLNFVPEMLKSVENI